MDAPVRVPEGAEQGIFGDALQILVSLAPFGYMSKEQR